jgi:hypothetical protein
MKVKVQVVTITEDGQEITREVACLEWEDLTPVTLGLSLAEGKTVLQALPVVGHCRYATAIRGHSTGA